jgi:purine-binding chemotaxis protein CheW
MSNLAKRPPGTVQKRSGSNEKRTEYLAFILAGDTYAVRISVVSEILRPPPITEVPRAPSPIIGVVSVRGRLVTVMDLRRRFALAEAPIDMKTRILIVELPADELVGLLVDEVRSVYRLAESEIEPASVLGGEQPAYLLGVGRPKEDTGLVLVLLDLRGAIAS